MRSSPHILYTQTLVTDPGPTREKQQHGRMVEIERYRIGTLVSKMSGSTTVRYLGNDCARLETTDTLARRPLLAGKCESVVCEASTLTIPSHPVISEPRRRDFIAFGTPRHLPRHGP